MAGILGSNTLDMSLVKVVCSGRILKGLMDIQRTDDGEKATYSDPDVNGNVTRFLKKNNMATFDVTVRNGSDDYDFLMKLYNNGIPFQFTYMDLRKIYAAQGGTGLLATIDKHPGNGLEDDPTFTITIPNYVPNK